jgi:hypothetical protein
MLTLEPNAQVRSTCSPSLSLSPEPRKKMSLSSVNTRTHSLLCLQRWLKTEKQNVVARAAFSIALLPNLYKLATNYKVQDGMAEYSPPSP